MRNSLLNRRDFLKTTGALGTGVALAAGLRAPAGEPRQSTRLKLGMDNFAVRALGLKAPALLDYAASLRLDTLFISDLDSFESHEPAHLREIKARADDLGIQIYLGTWSICPTSRAFRDKWGTAEEHLALGLRMARALGSPVLRVILGVDHDRATEGGIEARIADMVKVLQAGRARALDAGVKIAVENHAGDMQAWELVTLIEAAGCDFVGANLDSGNATWTMEDPLESLRLLAPYVVCTSLRDSMVWETERGAMVQWTAMGEGCVDWKTWFAEFAKKCPTVPVNIETISGFPRELPYLTPDFWRVWPKARAADFAHFLALAKRGREIPPYRAPNPAAEPKYQKAELERSLRYCRETLGLGRR